MPLISATKWSYSYGEGFNAGETRVFGNLASAKAWAEQVVAPVVTTNDRYWQDLAKGEHVEFTRRTRSRLPYSFTRGRMRPYSSAPAGRYEAPVIIVPSVGERGVW